MCRDNKPHASCNGTAITNGNATLTRYSRRYPGAIELSTPMKIFSEYDNSTWQLSTNPEPSPPLTTGSKIFSSVPIKYNMNLASLSKDVTRYLFNILSANLAVDQEYRQ